MHGGTTCHVCAARILSRWEQQSNFHEASVCVMGVQCHTSLSSQKFGCLTVCKTHDLQQPRTAAKQTAKHMIDAATSERPTAREERGGCKGGSPSLEVCPGEEVRGNPETRGFSRKCRTASFSQFYLLMCTAAAKPQQSKRQLPGLQQAKKKLTGPQQSK